MAEDTLQTEANESLIEEMLRTASPVEIPGELTKNPVIHKGDADLPETPMVLKSITSAGYVYVWDTRTFEKIAILYYMVPQKMRQRRADGSFRFTTVDPKQDPVRGYVKCMLHKDGENREHYTQLGFRICNKDNITNAFQLKQHMSKKHPQEFRAIEEERLEKERQEDRELTRLLLKERAAPAPAVVEPIVAAKQEFYCSKCGSNFGAVQIRDKHELTCTK